MLIDLKTYKIAHFNNGLKTELKIKRCIYSSNLDRYMHLQLYLN